MNDHEALLSYFQDDHFQEFMKLWKEQMERYGEIMGAIHVPLSDENRECISSFMGKNYHRQSHAVIRASQLKKVIRESKFKDADMNIVVRRYFKEEILTKNDRKQLLQDQVDENLSKLLDSFKNTKAESWLSHCIKEKDLAYLMMCKEIKQHPTKFLTTCTCVMQALNQLPMWNGKKQLLALFASQIMGEPHGFDATSMERLLLEYGICFFQSLPSRPSSLIERNLLLASVGLYLGDINNYCMIAHIDALKNNQKHPAWNAFYEQFEIWNVNMLNLANITSIDPHSCHSVFIIENPSVFQSLVQFSIENDLSSFGFVCTTGVVNSCGYLLLDLIQKAQIQMYYSGDFDPEGLLIAERLIKRFPKNLRLWRYDEPSFFAAQSSNHPSKKRISMLNSLQNRQLEHIGTLMKESLLLGYQENILHLYQEDLINFHKSIQASTSTHM